MPYVATDTIVPVPELRAGDTILDGGEVFRLLHPAVPTCAYWRAYDTTGAMVVLVLPTNERRRVVGRIEG